MNSTKHKETGFVQTMVIDFKDINGNPMKYFLPIRDDGEAISYNFSTTSATSRNFGADNKPYSGGWQIDFSYGSDGKIKFSE